MNIDDSCIEFAGCRSGSGPLTWAQKSMWNNIQALAPNDAHLTMRVTVAVPDGVAVARAVEASRRLVCRHDGLRTTFPAGDGDQPVQRVAAGGQVPLAVADAGPDPGRAAEELLAHLSVTRFDTAAELPLRIGIVADSGGARYVVLAISHLAVDAWSIDLLHAELAALLSAAEAGPADPTRQPLEQARYEQEVLAPQVEERAIAYWKTTLESCPPSNFLGAAHQPASPRFADGWLHSEAVAVAGALLAAELGVGRNAVLLTAFARVLSEYGRWDGLPLWLRVSNRFDPELQRSVLYLSQNVPVVIDLSIQPFAGLARHVQQATMRAYRYSQYDPDRMLRLLAAVDAGRDVPVDLSATFNGTAADAGLSMGTAEPRGLMRHTTFTWNPGFDSERIRLFFNAGDTDLSLVADTCCLSPEQIEAVLRGVEDLLVRAAGS